MSGGADRTLIAGIVLGAVAVSVAVAAIAGVFGGGDARRAAATDFGVTAAPAPAAPPTQPKVKRIPVGGRPDTIAAGAGYVWVGDTLAGTLKRINPRSHRPVAVGPAGFPTDISAGEGAAWLALPDRGAVQPVKMNGPQQPVKLQSFPFQVAAGEGSVWAMSQKSVERVDPGTRASEGSPLAIGGSGTAIAAGEGWIWVVRGNREVVRFRPGDGEPSPDAAPVPGAFNLTVGESAAWALGTDGALTRIDPKSGAVAGDPVPTGRPLDVAAGLGYVWVTSADGTVIRIEPESGAEVGVPIPVGEAPESIAVGEGAVWVAAAGDGAVYRIKP